MPTNDRKVLLIGATGVFGRHTEEDGSTGSIRTVLTTENEVILCLCAVAGMDLRSSRTGWLPRILPRDAWSVFLAEELNLSVNLQAVYPSRRLLPARVREFLDFLPSWHA